MTQKQYRSLLIESTVSGIGKIDVYKSPADKIVDSIKTGNADEAAASSSRCACDAIAVLGRIYDAEDEDRPMITENDEENEAQGDSEISVDLPDSTEEPPVQNISDVIDDDKGTPPGNEETQKPEETIADEDGGLTENFILEDDEELDGSELPEDEEDEDETEEELPEDEDELPEDDETVEEEDEGLPEDEEELPEDDETVKDDESDTDDELPEDEEEFPEDDESEGDEELPEDVVVDEDDEGLPEDEEELPEDDEPVEGDDGEELPEDDVEEVATVPEVDDLDGVEEDVDDSELPEDEQTGSGTILGDGSGEAIPAEPIDKDGEVYEGVDDPALDPNAAAPAPVAPAAPADPNAAAPAPEEGGEAPVEDPAAQGGDPNAVPPEGEAPAEDPTVDPNNEQDPVLDIDSQVVATDTTQESVLESLIREMKSSDEGYMQYESEDFDSED